MSIEEVMKQVASSVEKEGNAKAVFGEPMKLDSHTVIPVALVSVGGGAGGSGAFDKAATAPMPSVGGVGAGVGINVRPVGFIHERGSEVVFTPIHLDVRGKPMLSEAATGVGKAIEMISSIVSGVAQSRLGHRAGPGA